VWVPWLGSLGCRKCNDGLWLQVSDQDENAKQKEELLKQYGFRTPQSFPIKWSGWPSALLPYAAFVFSRCCYINNPQCERVHAQIHHHLDCTRLVRADKTMMRAYAGHRRHLICQSWLEYSSRMDSSLAWTALTHMSLRSNLLQALWKPCMKGWTIMRMRSLQRPS
jgi:hypothetical protein